MLNQLNLVVQDMDRTVAFYRLLGLAIDAEPGAALTGAGHAGQSNPTTPSGGPGTPSWKTLTETQSGS